LTSLPEISKPETLTVSDEKNFANEIEIKSVEMPLISIIIPIYGQLNYTLRCLASIEKTSLELISR